MDGDMREEELNLFCCLPKMRIAAKEPVYTARSSAFMTIRNNLVLVSIEEIIADSQLSDCLFLLHAHRPARARERGKEGDANSYHVCAAHAPPAMPPASPWSRMRIVAEPQRASSEILAGVHTADA